MDRRDSGFFRVAACVPRVEVADCEGNRRAIVDMLDQVAKQGVQLAVFPEMCITAYTCADLFHNQALLKSARAQIDKLVEYSKNEHWPAFVVGAPLYCDGALYNCAVMICGGSILAIVPKTYVPNYNEFYEKRWWNSAADREETINLQDGPGFLSTDSMAEIDGVKVGIEICEDLWAPIPPSCNLAMAGAQVIVNLSASDDLIGKYQYLRSLILQQSARCIAGYVYSSAGYGESSTDLVFDGKAFIAENGTMLEANKRWQNHPQYVIADIDVYAIERDRMHNGTFADCARRNLHGDYLIMASLTEQQKRKGAPELMRRIDPQPFVPPTDAAMAERCDEIINIQAAGLARRLDFIKCKTLVVGISGGLDSTLALLVACKAYDRLGLDRKGIIGITMPGFGTTKRTKGNATRLMEELGVTSREISISKAVERHFIDIDHDPAVKDVTYENSQARERTQILMDVANQVGGIVLGTGDLSELALGWATYNGDHMSMYGVNAGVPKTLVKHLVRYFATETQDENCRHTLLDIIDTPISPELIPADEKGNITQKTEDLVGPYELHDFFLYYMLRYGFSPARVYYLAVKAFEDQFDAKTILKWLRVFYRRFFAQQFKRSCLPDGPKVGSVCLSPRGDWRMPSDAAVTLWLKEIDEIQPPR
ncbi:MAG: NAD(+) synthase [Bacteroidales bacterium]|nr:NAD(+) synthase [Bacteroidales bacterium]